MSDLAYWEEAWRDKVFEKAAKTPQNTYLFLTKRPELLDMSIDDDNVWMGVTVTCRADKQRIATLRERVRARHYHVTFEPLFGPVGELDLAGVEWIVIGTETGRRRGRVDAQVEWVSEIVERAHRQGVPIFMKEDLLPIMGESGMIQ